MECHHSHSMSFRVYDRRVEIQKLDVLTVSHTLLAVVEESTVNVHRLHQSEHRDLIRALNHIYDFNSTPILLQMKDYSEIISQSSPSAPEYPMTKNQCCKSKREKNPPQLLS